MINGVVFPGHLSNTVIIKITNTPDKPVIIKGTQTDNVTIKVT